MRGEAGGGGLDDAVEKRLLAGMPYCKKCHRRTANCKHWTPKAGQDATAGSPAQGATGAGHVQAAVDDGMMVSPQKTGPVLGSYFGESPGGSMIGIQDSIGGMMHMGDGMPAFSGPQAGPMSLGGGMGGEPHWSGMGPGMMVGMQGVSGMMPDASVEPFWGGGVGGVGGGGGWGPCGSGYGMVGVVDALPPGLEVRGVMSGSGSWAEDHGSPMAMSNGGGMSKGMAGEDSIGMPWVGGVTKVHGVGRGKGQSSQGSGRGQGGKAGKKVGA